MCELEYRVSWADLYRKTRTAFLRAIQVKLTPDIVLAPTIWREQYYL